ncbi:MAG: hypothetical protein DRQ08_00775 [Candidatus Latescibacterota bacterium]|nr:MAG: hypothetical protein DRQ08_00775 [Candidatus Latescibacterota bacterium]
MGGRRGGLGRRGRSLKVVALGTINRDTIRTPDGEVTESYGGLLYTLLALASLWPEASVHPVCNVGEDVWEAVASLLFSLPSVGREGVRKVPCKNNHVSITYDEEGGKEEVLEGGVPPLGWEQLEPFLDADAFCINFISGFELSLDTLRRLRRCASGTFFMDFHSLSLGLAPDGRRFPRRPEDWRDWVALTDVIQMNELEAELLFGKPVTDEEGVAKFGEEVLSLGPRILCVTLGEEGSLLAERTSEGLRTGRFEAASVEAADTTGCGDVFLAGFAVEYLRSGDARRASEFANLAAGLNATLRGVEEVTKLGELMVRRGTSPEGRPTQG